MRSFGVVARAVLPSENASFEEVAEEFSVQQVLTERSTRAFDVGVLPRSARLDESSFGVEGGQMVLDGLLDKLQPAAAAEKGQYATFGH